MPTSFRQKHPARKPILWAVLEHFVKLENSRTCVMAQLRVVG